MELHVCQLQTVSTEGFTPPFCAYIVPMSQAVI
jgi:hypothetical protein